ncbi:MAG: class I SAM-dependent methyltransferase [Candidatus Eremiobacteraeota bacterium]|nr:class I SAM-dependent methyltransferase [Candidatus Eremiobacteraeota bacterium]
MLAATGARVIGVEPNEEMRGKITDTNFEVVARQANETGLPEKSCDLVTAFQAFHWFATSDAMQEFRRILRPGGRLAVVRNARDDSDAFTGGYGDIFEKPRGNEMRKSMRFGSETTLHIIGENEFVNGRLHSIFWSQPMRLGDLLGRARSISYMPRGTAADELLRKIEHWHGEHANEQGFADFKYRTDIYLAESQDR